jgi:ADP-heptose:LPS heptosyltransferase
VAVTRDGGAAETRAGPAGDRARRPGPILVVLRDLGLGDFLTGIPALRALARAFPEHRRVLVAPAVLAPLVALSRTGFELWPDPPPGADVAVNLHGRGPQSHVRLLAARPRRLIAFACGDHAGPEWRAGEHEVHRWCRLLAESGIETDPDDLDLDLPVTPTGATVIHPGAASEARRWPAERWAAIARIEAEAGHDVVITGDARERELAARIADGLPRATVVAGQTDLAGLAATVAGAGRVLCGDTGVGHLATAFRIPSVVLFGPTPPAEWGPPPDRSRHTALWAGRRGDPHADAPDPGLLEISVEDVLAALCRPGRAQKPRAAASVNGGR